MKNQSLLFLGLALFFTATQCWAPPIVAGAAIAAGAASVAAAVAGTAVLAAMASTFFVTLVLSAASQALAKKPEDPALASRTQTIKTPIGAREFVYGQVRKGGQLTYAAVLGVTTSLGGGISSFKRTLNLIITFTGHEVEEIGDIWFNNRVVPLDGNDDATGFYEGYAHVEKRLGTLADAPFDNLAALGVPGIAAFHQYGCARIWAQLAKNNEAFPNGPPNITAVIKGRKCYDPRTGLTAWTDNPALCIANYLCTPRAEGGLGAAYATAINEPALIAAANICDETVSIVGGSEKRYTLNGSFSTANKPRDIIQSMLSAMAGTCVRVGGVWTISAGAYVTPTVTLTESDARGPIRTQARLSRAEIFNGVKGVYTSPGNFWQPADFPAVTNATYLAQDNGERLWRDIELAFTTSSAMAQRLAKIELERARQQISVDFPANLRGLLVQAGGTVMVDSTAKGWSGKAFEVVRSQLVIYDADGSPALGVDLGLRETAAGVWDWNSGEETEVDLAPDTDLANPFEPIAPGIVSVEEQLYETTGSAGVKALAVVTLGVVDDGSFPDYELQYRLAGASTWEARPISKNSAQEIDDLAPGRYEFRARSFNGLGAASDWSATFTKELLGLTAPPADITGFSVRAMAGAAWVTFDLHADLDVIQGGSIILRHSPDTGGPDWNEGNLLAPPDDAGFVNGWPGDSVLAIAPLASGTYMAKARDSTGNMSENAVSFELTEADITGYATVTTITEDPAFPGAKTTIAVVDGGLQLANATLVDDLGDVDDIIDWDAEGELATSGTYSFNSALDLGSLQTVRLFPTLRSIAFDTAELWDDRTGNIDDWPDIDGALVDDVEATLYVRVTPDDPGGSPVWGPWHPLPGPADYTCWGAEFKLEWLSQDPTHNRNVDQLRVVAKQAA